MLRGNQTFDHVCVRDGGTLVADGNLTLRVGILYIARGGAINADGMDGYEWDTHDCIGGQSQPDGAAGHHLTVIVRRAVILGQVSAGGGRGLGVGPYCGGYGAPGHGGAGGVVGIMALDLVLDGRVTARGGPGGAATSSTPTYPSPSTLSGEGGPGGHVTIALARPLSAPERKRLDVGGGAAGAYRRQLAGKAGAAGSAIIRVLTTSEEARIPAVPASPVTFVGAMPARQPLDPSFARPAEMRCGAGDLIVRRGDPVTLGGVHRYAHVCVENGGVLAGRGDLTLVARMIAIAPGGRVTADGAGPLPFHWSDSGRYASRGACAATHAPPHGGVRGPAGDSSYNGSRSSDAAANPGDGSNLLTLIAYDAALDGQVSATGGTGQDGWSVDSPAGGTTPPIPYGAGGGGSGGGIEVVARWLRLGGAISVAGGHGGYGLGPDDPAGRHGGPGCIKVFADTLQAPVSGLPLAGQAVVARPLPTDPVPPAPGARYDAVDAHNLSGPFLRFWQRHGGLDALGGPRSEPFFQNGHLAQYTGRALLQLVGGQVRLAPLGRDLTAGRAFPPVASFVSSPARRYFPATGHSLAGRFLTYWRVHDGATLLGAPISEALVEGNGDGSGRRYPMQWFERGRLEYHAEHAGTRYAVQVGLLGVEALRRRGWLPPVTPLRAPSSALGAGGSPSIHLYAATRAGVVFGSDGSRQWRFLTGPHTVSPEGCSNIAALATADAGRTVYAGTCSGGVWRSRDGGHTWVEDDQGLPGDNIAVLGLVVAPDQRTIYAANEGAVYKTTNAGVSWSSVFEPSEQDYVVEAVALDPRRPDHLWAGTEGSGLFRSMDAGRHWTRVQGIGFPANALIAAITPSPTDSADVYVSTQNDDVYRTRDGGAHWSTVHGPWEHGSAGSAGDISDITFDPLQPGHIYAGASDGEYVSRDNGVSWSKGRGPAAGDYAVVVSRSHPGLAYLISEPVVYRTVDGGLSWQPWDGGDLRVDDDVVALAGDAP